MSRIRGLVEKLDPRRRPGVHCREHCGGNVEKGTGGFEGQEHDRCAPGGDPRAREKISHLVGGSQHFSPMRIMIRYLFILSVWYENCRYWPVDLVHSPDRGKEAN